MINITKETFKSEVEGASGLVIIDLWAQWCGPCRLLAPIMEELERDNPDVKFCKIDVDDQPELAQAFNVQSIPMVAFVKDNTFIDLSVGYVPKEKLQRMIEEHR